MSLSAICLKEKGYIRYWGVSLNTFSPGPEANFIFENHIGSGLQVVYNILNHKSLDIIREGHSKGFGVIARMPLQFGLLSGKISSETRFQPDDHRSTRLNSSFLDNIEPELRYFFERCKEFDWSPVEVALGFALGEPGVSTVIPGIKDPTQARINAAAFRGIKPKAIEELLTHYTLIQDKILQLLKEAEKVINQN